MVLNYNLSHGKHRSLLPFSSSFPLKNYVFIIRVYTQTKLDSTIAISARKSKEVARIGLSNV